MKIRIGLGLGTQTLAGDAERFAGFVDALEAARLRLAVAQRAADRPGARPARRPGRGRRPHPQAQARHQRAGGARPQPGGAGQGAGHASTGCRAAGCCPAVGLGAPVPAEHRAFGVERGQRAGLFDEAVALMRRLWTEDDVHHDGEHFHVDGVTLRPRPLQQPIDVWLGGTSPSELRRTGRLGDGWLPSFTVPGRGRGRAGPPSPRWPPSTAGPSTPSTWACSCSTPRGELPDAHRRGGGVPAPDARPARGRARRASTACAASSSGSSRVGASKFVVVPLAEPADWDAELDELAEDDPQAARDLTGVQLRRRVRPRGW